MEVRQRIRNVTVEDGWVLVKINGVPDRPGISARIFAAIAAADVPVDMILQNAGNARVADLSFTIKAGNVTKILPALQSIRSDIGAKGLETLDHLAKVELVGTGILTDPSCVGKLFRALADANVNIVGIGTSEIRISCLVESENQKRAQEALYWFFKIDETGSQPT